MIQDFLYLKDKNIKDVLELIMETYLVSYSDPEPVLKRNGFGKAHHRLISLIDNNPGIKLTDILKKLKVTKQSLSRVIKELKKKNNNIIVQKKSEKDARENLLFLSEKGNALYNEIFEIQKDRILKAFKNCSTDEVISFKKVLLKIVAQ
jgi:DNA-binding MarR family transcriptional regulator